MYLHPQLHDKYLAYAVLLKRQARHLEVADPKYNSQNDEVHAKLMLAETVGSPGGLQDRALGWIKACTANGLLGTQGRGWGKRAATEAKDVVSSDSDGDFSVTVSAVVQHLLLGSSIQKTTTL